MRTTPRRGPHDETARRPLRARHALVVVAVVVLAVVVGRAALTTGRSTHAAPARTSATASTTRGTRTRPTGIGRSGTDRSISADHVRPAGRLHALPAPPALPADAAQVAAAYTIAVYDWGPGATESTWLASLVPLTTPSWLSRLDGADPTTPSGEVVATVVQVLPARATAPDVAADVVVQQTPGGTTALLVDLVPAGTGWAVAGSS